MRARALVCVCVGDVRANVRPRNRVYRTVTSPSTRLSEAQQSTQPAVHGIGAHPDCA